MAVLSLAKRVCDIDERQYGRPKFVLQCVDFWVPYKIGENDREMVPYGAVPSISESFENYSRRVLARRACAVELSRCGRSKTRNNFSIFERRAK